MISWIGYLVSFPSIFTAQQHCCLSAGSLEMAETGEDCCRSQGWQRRQSRMGRWSGTDPVGPARDGPLGPLVGCRGPRWPPLWSLAKVVYACEPVGFEKRVHRSGLSTFSWGFACVSGECRIAVWGFLEVGGDGGVYSAFRAFVRLIDSSRGNPSCTVPADAFSPRHGAFEGVV